MCFFFFFGWQKCDLAEPFKNVNGKPIVPILNERTLPKFLETARMEKAVNRTSTRLKLFSGTANPALSQVRLVFSFGWWMNVLLLVKCFLIKWWEKIMG